MHDTRNYRNGRTFAVILGRIAFDAQPLFLSTQPARSTILWVLTPLDKTPDSIQFANFRSLPFVCSHQQLILDALSRSEEICCTRTLNNILVLHSFLLFPSKRKLASSLTCCPFSCNTSVTPIFQGGTYRYEEPVL